MEFEVLNRNGEKTGKKVNLPDGLINEQPNDHVIWLEVKRYLAAQRQGTHKSKERAEITGSTRKLRKQKGSGAARVGDIKSPIFRGGGRIFGPRPRDYDFKLNKKVKRLARKSAIAYKAQNEQLFILEDFQMDAPKTKEYAQMLNKLQLQDKKPVLVLSERSDNILRSARNIRNASVITVDQLNTYSIMNTHALIVSESAVDAFRELLN